MCDVLRSRGPDDSGVVHENDVSLGIRRLSIIDPEGGAQPISNENGTIWIVCNGEIYNHSSIRSELRERGHQFSTDVDIEVIVHGYEEWGKEVVDHLNGMFAFTIWDSVNDRVTLARDRLGIKPLYYAPLDGEIVFASELTALLEHSGIDLGICETAVHYYWALQYVPAPLSILSSVRKLEPATIATTPIDDPQLSTEQYWSADKKRAASGSVRESLKSSVEKRLMADVPLGAFLSGGIDSTAIVALMSEISPDPVRTYSIAFADEDYDESSFSRRVAEDLGTDHCEIRFRRDDMRIFDEVIARIDEPLADPAIVPTYLLADRASKDVKTVLTGEGSDELFAGYDYYHEYANLWDSLSGFPSSTYQLSNALEKIVPAGNRVAHYLRMLSAHERQSSAFTEHLLPDQTSEQWQAFEFSLGIEAISQLLERNVEKSFSSDDFRRNLLRFDQRNWLPDDLLVKVDRMTMANCLEARVPFLDHRLVEHINAIPVRKHYSGRTKPVLRRAVREIVPAYVLEREKHGFRVPLDEWFSEPHERVDDLFDKDVLTNTPFIDADASISLLERHRSGTISAPWVLWRVLVYVAWHTKHIKSKQHYLE